MSRLFSANFNYVNVFSLFSSTCLKLLLVGQKLLRLSVDVLSPGGFVFFRVDSIFSFVV